MNHAGMQITATHIGTGLASVFTVALGGMIIGVVMGVLTALITKTTTQVRGIIICIFPIEGFNGIFNLSVVEPLAVFCMALLAYFTAELFHWSGIVRQGNFYSDKWHDSMIVSFSLIACGLVQAHYSFRNISKKSYTTVKYFIKMLRYIYAVPLGYNMGKNKA